MRTRLSKLSYHCGTMVNLMLDNLDNNTVLGMNTVKTWKSLKSLQQLESTGWKNCILLGTRSECRSFSNCTNKQTPIHTDWTPFSSSESCPMSKNGVVLIVDEGATKWPEVPGWNEAWGHRPAESGYNLCVHRHEGECSSAPWQLDMVTRIKPHYLLISYSSLCQHVICISTGGGVIPITVLGFCWIDVM